MLYKLACLILFIYMPVLYIFLVVVAKRSCMIGQNFFIFVHHIFLHPFLYGLDIGNTVLGRTNAFVNSISK